MVFALLEELIGQLETFVTMSTKKRHIMNFTTGGAAFALAGGVGIIGTIGVLTAGVGLAVALVGSAIGAGKITAAKGINNAVTSRQAKKIISSTKNLIKVMKTNKQDTTGSGIKNQGTKRKNDMKTRDYEMENINSGT